MVRPGWLTAQEPALLSVLLENAWALTQGQGHRRGEQRWLCAWFSGLISHCRAVCLSVVSAFSYKTNAVAAAGGTGCSPPLPSSTLQLGEEGAALSCICIKVIV